MYIRIEIYPTRLGVQPLRTQISNYIVQVGDFYAKLYNKKTHINKIMEYIILLIIVLVILLLVVVLAVKDQK